MRNWHLGVGWFAFLAFLATGVYMRLGFPELYGSNEAIRYQFRGNHIYVLFAALLNVVSARGALSPVSGWRKSVAMASSAMILLAPLILLAAFFSEPIRGAQDKPLTFLGVASALAGVVLAQFLSAISARETQ